jgi:hypothetical protein
MGVGDKIRFAEEKMAYIVQACNERFAVCTKPFNPKHTVLYTIIDLGQGVRGTEDLIFCMGFETRRLCEEALERLNNGESKISSRNKIPLNIIETVNPL